MLVSTSTAAAASFQLTDLAFTTARAGLGAALYTTTPWPVGLALYGRSNRKPVGSSEPLRSAPPASGIDNI
eukprot:2818902-Pleurochrysis_carterae.AAC.1